MGGEGPSGPLSARSPRRRWLFRSFVAVAVIFVLAVSGAVLVGIEATDAVFSNAPRSYANADPRSVGLGYEEVVFHSPDGLELSGWWIDATCPAKANVVAVPGYTSNRGQLLGVLSVFANACFNVFAIDLRGQNKSDGYPTLGAREPLDVEAAVEVAAVNGLPVVLYGQSMGGASVIIAAAEMNASRPGTVVGVIADSAFATAESALKRGIPRTSGYPEFPTVAITIAAAKLRLGVDVAAIRPVDSVSELGAPLLVIHGGNDEVVPISDGEKIYAAAAHPKEFWMIEGSGHVRALADRPVEFRSRVLDFLDRYAVA